MSLPDFTPTLGRGALDGIADVRELTGNTPATHTHTRGRRRFVNEDNCWLRASTDNIDSQRLHLCIQLRVKLPPPSPS